MSFYYFIFSVFLFDQQQGRWQIICNVFVTNMLYSFYSLVICYVFTTTHLKQNVISSILSRQNRTISRWINKFFSYSDNSSALQLHKHVLRPLV